MLALLILLAACPATTSEPEPTPTPADLCPDSVVGATEVFATGFDGTEGLTFTADGRMFVGDSDLIAEVFPDGTWAEFATVPGSIGLAVWDDVLYVASSTDENGNDGIWSVDVDSGEAQLFASVEGANFLTVSPWGTLIVTDPNQDRIYEVGAEGNQSVWLEDHISPNGSAFTADGGALWVATTYADVQPVWRIPIEGGGPGTPESVAEFGAGDVGDGLVLGASGAAYVEQNIGGRIDVVHPDGTVEVLSAEVPWGASLAFGEGEGWDPCSVYATSLFSGDLFRVQVGERGTPVLR